MKTRQDFTGRLELKKKFAKGKLPTAAAFEQLIDSMVNKVDDGFAKGEDYGLALGPEGEDKKLMSFFENVQERKLAWKLSLSGEEDKKGLDFSAPPPANGSSNTDDDPPEAKSRLFIRQDGNVGIGENVPDVNLDVAGTVGMQARIGSIGVKKRAQIAKKVIGNGKWHTVLTLTPNPDDMDKGDIAAYFNIMDFHSFEIMATIKKSISKGKYKQAMLHAIAMSCPGGDGKSIKKTQTSSGWDFLNHLQIRWKQNRHNLDLQIRTRTTYGPDSITQNFPPIRYHITSLWDSNVFRD